MSCTLVVTPQLCFLVCGDTCEDADTCRVGYDREGRAPTQRHLPAHREDSEQPMPSHTGQTPSVSSAGVPTSLLKPHFQKKHLIGARPCVPLTVSGRPGAVTKDLRVQAPGPRTWAGGRRPLPETRGIRRLLTHPAASTQDPSRAAANPAGAHTLLHGKVSGPTCPSSPCLGRLLPSFFLQQNRKGLPLSRRHPPEPSPSRCVP